MCHYWRVLNDMSLNNNANSGIGRAPANQANQANQANRANQAQQNSFDGWQTALGAGLGFLAGSWLGRGSSSPYSYGYYGYPYYPYNYYYGGYPHYYYYYG
ncbi:unnamed protein product [Brugia timori]|uniref:Shematrin-like protein 1 n=1 Tax=Brugia timori TaxID=42155 RepID=A0A0R3R296_9BILA|nr:unnamed protein product [Brugia timori]